MIVSIVTTRAYGPVFSSIPVAIAVSISVIVSMVALGMVSLVVPKSCASLAYLRTSRARFSAPMPTVIISLAPSITIVVSVFVSSASYRGRIGTPYW